MKIAKPCTIDALISPCFLYTNAHTRPSMATKANNGHPMFVTVDARNICATANIRPDKIAARILFVSFSKWLCRNPRKISSSRKLPAKAINKRAGTNDSATTPPLSSRGTNKPSSMNGTAAKTPPSMPARYVFQDAIFPHLTRALNSFICNRRNATIVDSPPKINRINASSINLIQSAVSVIPKLQKPIGVIVSRMSTKPRIKRNILAAICFLGKRRNTSVISIKPGVIRRKYVSNSSILLA